MHITSRIILEYGSKHVNLFAYDGLQLPEPTKAREKLHKIFVSTHVRQRKLAH